MVVHLFATIKCSAHCLHFFRAIVWEGLLARVHYGFRSALEGATFAGAKGDYAALRLCDSA